MTKSSEELSKNDEKKEEVETITSSTTILFKIVLPTIWLTFFGLFTIAVFVTSESSLGVVSMVSARIIMPIVFIVGGVFLWFTFMSLKKIEASHQFFYITNYFKTFKYKYDNIEKIEEQNYYLFKVLVFTFKEKTSFGKSIFGVQSKRGFERFMKNNPEFVRYFLDE